MPELGPVSIWSTRTPESWGTAVCVNSQSEMSSTHVSLQKNAGRGTPRQRRDRPSSATSTGSTGSALHPCRSLLRGPASARGDLTASASAWPTDVAPEPEPARGASRVVGARKLDEQPVASATSQRPATSPGFWGRDAVSGCSRCRDLGQRVRQLQRELAACQQARLVADHRASDASANLDAAMAWQRHLLRGLRELGAALPDERDGRVVSAPQAVDAVRSLLRQRDGVRAVPDGKRHLSAPTTPTGNETLQVRPPLPLSRAAERSDTTEMAEDVDPRLTVREELGGSSLDDGSVLRRAVPAVASTTQSGAPVGRQQPKAPTRTAPSVAAAGIAVTRFQLGPMLAKMASASSADTMRQHATSLPVARAGGKRGSH
eukprot:COSAG02_NODE_970_length_15551_cov_4.985698_15_plen_375_part_00